MVIETDNIVKFIAYLVIKELVGSVCLVSP